MIGEAANVNFRRDWPTKEFDSKGIKNLKKEK
jgi:hypothetical protein